MESLSSVSDGGRTSCYFHLHACEHLLNSVKAIPLPNRESVKSLIFELAKNKDDKAVEVTIKQRAVLDQTHAKPSSQSLFVCMARAMDDGLSKDVTLALVVGMYGMP